MQQFSCENNKKKKEKLLLWHFVVFYQSGCCSVLFLSLCLLSLCTAELWFICVAILVVFWGFFNESCFFPKICLLADEEVLQKIAVLFYLFTFPSNVLNNSCNIFKFIFNNYFIHSFSQNIFSLVFFCFIFICYFFASLQKWEQSIFSVSVYVFLLLFVGRQN